MKKILSILGIFSLMPIMALAETSGIAALEGQLQTETKSGLNLVYFMLKVGGFGVIIWGIADLMAEEKGGGDSGGKYIKAVIKLIVGALFIASQTLAGKLGLSS